MSSVSSSSSGLCPLLILSKGENPDLNLPWRDVVNNNVSVDKNGVVLSQQYYNQNLLVHQQEDISMDITTTNTTREEVKIDTRSVALQAPAAASFSKYPGATPGRNLQPPLPTATAATSTAEGESLPLSDSQAEFFAGLLPTCETFKEYSMAVRIESPSSLTSQLDVLVDKAKKEKLSPHKGATWNGSCLRILLHMAFLMKVNLDAIFAAIEVFDRFTIEMNNNLGSDLAGLSRKRDQSQFVEARKRIRHQVPLRMASCLQLCHKLHSDISTADISLEQIERILTSLKFYYTSTAIAKSEMRVFRTLNFRLAYPNAWEVATTLLACIPDLNSAIRATVLQQTASLLFMAYEHHTSLVNALWTIHISSNRNLPQTWSDRNNPSIQQSRHFKEEMDSWRSILFQDFPVILGGGALATSFTVLMNCPRSPGKNSLAFLQRDMTKEIARYLRTPQMRVSDMSIAMLQIAVTSSLPAFNSA